MIRYLDSLWATKDFMKTSRPAGSDKIRFGSTDERQPSACYRLRVGLEALGASACDVPEFEGLRCKG